MMKWLITGLIVLGLIAGLTGQALAAAPDEEALDPGPPPKGMAVKVFIHYPKGHAGKDTDVAAAGLTTDPSYGLSGIRWQDPNGADNRGIPYYLNLNYSTKVSPRLTKAAAMDALVASFNGWVEAQDTAVLSPYGKLLYRNVGDTGVKAPRLDGRNVISWGALSSGTIAVTYVWYYTATKYIAEFDMVFNDKLPWAYTLPNLTGVAYDPNGPNNDGSGGTYGDPLNSGMAGTYDLRDIGTHEAGHTLMLNDLYAASNADLTMYGYGTTAELKKDTLGLGDYTGLNAIY